MDFEKIAPLALLGFTQFLGWLGSRNKQSEADAQRDKIFNELFLEQKEQLDKLQDRVEFLEGEVKRLQGVEAENISLKAQLAQRSALTQ